MDIRSITTRGGNMIYKCKYCKKESDYLDVEILNVLQTTVAFIGDHHVMYSDCHSHYKESKYIYFCPNCGEGLPMVNDTQGLLKYLREK